MQFKTFERWTFAIVLFLSAHATPLAAMAALVLACMSFGRRLLLEAGHGCVYKQVGSTYLEDKTPVSMGDWRAGQ